MGGQYGKFYEEENAAYNDKDWIKKQGAFLLHKKRGFGVLIDFQLFSYLGCDCFVAGSWPM